MNNSKRFTSTKKTYGLVFGLLIAFLVASIVLPAVFATTPAANTQIKNSASASYTDAQGRPLTATSNEVTTFVQQVDVFTLTSNGSKTATVGSQVVYPHTLINTGNGTETITLSAVAGPTFTHTGIAMYIDANGDGIPDNLTPVTSVTLAAGEVYKFVAVGTVPAAATGTGTLVVKATDATAGVTAFGPVSNTDTTTVTTYASVQVTKGLSTITGPTGTTTTVTLAYTNTGNATANNIVISDTLATGWAFQTGTVKWSTTGATTITEDAVANVSGGNSITFDKTLAPKYVVTLLQIPSNTSGFVQFNVTVSGNPGIYTNVATYAYQDGSVLGGGATISGNSTNVASFTIQGSAGVSITGQTVASAYPGTTVTFDNTVTSNSTVTDTYNITLATVGGSYSDFPAGSSFQLFKSDGNTPLVDTNADGTPDTGPMAPGATYHVFLKVTLPNGATATGAPFGIKKVATSTATGVLNQGATANATDALTTVSSLSMDLTQVKSIAGGADATNGFGPYTSAVIPPSPTILPGASATYPLYVNNTSPLADTYNMYAASTESAGGSTSGTLAAGLSVTFRLSTGSDCSAGNLGATITNTGSVGNGSNQLVCAIVTTTPTFTGGTYNVYFLSKSPTTGTYDQIHDQFTVTTVHNVTITPNNTGQIYPGGTVVYAHQLINGGNATESVVFGSLVQTQPGWTAVLYYDNNHNGLLDPGDTAIAPADVFLPLSFTPGTSVDLLVKVQSVSSAAVGAVDIATVSVTYAGGTVTATDTTTVIAGQLRLVKTQALDAACDGTPDTAYSATDITTGAVPGACIIYQIVASNEGTDNVSAVVISDSTPAFTVYKAQALITVCSTGTAVAPTTLTAGPLSCTLAAPLAPGATVTMKYSVKINP